MSTDERDLRMVLVAFEDAATWCESLADLADRIVRTAQAGEPLSTLDLEAAASSVDETRRYLESNRAAVRRVTRRLGLP